MMKFWLLPLAALALPSLAGTFTGYMKGSFSDPVLTGKLWSLAGLDATARDNSSTASYSGFDSSSTTAVWGCCPFPAVDPGVPESSQVVFQGAAFSGVVGDSTLFRLGSITFTNGTSQAASLIFGGTLSLRGYDNWDNPLTDVLNVPFRVDTTRNVGDKYFNADFVTFTTGSGDYSSGHVLESETATFDLYGMIVGDPQIFFDGLVLSPQSAGAGFVGAGVPGQVPEPSTLWLALPLAGLLARRSRASRR